VLVGLVVLMAAPQPAAAQGYEPALVRVTGFGGVSLRQGITGFRIAEDVRSASVRVTWVRSRLRPWVQAERFVRPALECQPPLTCNEDGWTALVGVSPAFSPGGADTGPGLHPYVTTAIGWAFAEQDQFAYLLGVGAALPITPWLAPSLEFRWEDLPGIRNVLMMTAGIRLDLF
jgi:hypothetical protein